MRRTDGSLVDPVGLPDQRIQAASGMYIDFRRGSVPSFIHSGGWNAATANIAEDRGASRPIEDAAHQESDREDDQTPR